MSATITHAVPRAFCFKCNDTHQYNPDTFRCSKCDLIIFEVAASDHRNKTAFRKSATFRGLQSFYGKLVNENSEVVDLENFVAQIQTMLARGANIKTITEIAGVCRGTALAHCLKQLEDEREARRDR